MVDGYARFIESALKSGNAVIVVVNEEHRARLLRRLEADGVNVPAAIEQGSYISLDAADALSRLTVNDTPDPVRCAQVIGDLIVEAAKGVKGEHGRVARIGSLSLLRKALRKYPHKVRTPQALVIHKSKESARNIQRFMDWNTSRPLV